ncbi:MAG TPA: hypothetical protein VHY75_00405 [Steroidobacteraceae bacterium]|nr:hypothetical protein [Steroidobacteraceae bacterium]
MRQRRKSIRIRQALKSLGLLLLLMATQQGAVVHELGHEVEAIGGADARDLPGRDETPCALCPSFAQVVAPAFSHTFHLPLLVRAALEPTSEPLFRVVDTAVPTPRSRGPPSEI